MSIREKHLKFLQEKDYWKTRIPELISKIQSDSTGSFWHLEETIKKINESLQQDSLSLEEKKKLPFGGLTVGVKDLFCVKGLTTTAGSKILESFISPYDSTVFETLSQKGAILGGKLSMDEFAMGSFTNTSYLGKTSVPEFPEHSAGGSSGGSAAAVASGAVDFSIGSDTGGSVRLPASYCGVVGYKPSYGAFSRFGMIPYASSLDQAGFLTKTLEDMVYLLEQDISFKDNRDMTCVGLGKYSKTNSEIKSVGYFKEILESSEIQSDVRKAYKQTLYMLDKAGIKLVPIEIDFIQQAAQIYYIIACSEASSNLARYQGVYFGKKLSEEQTLDSFSETISEYRSKYFGKEVQKRIMLGSSILSAENFTVMYEKAWNMRRALSASIQNTLDIVDTICLPVSPTTAPKWSEIEKMTSAQIYYSDYMTVPFSLAGVPAVSLPLFKSTEGLHIGMQFVGKKFEDYKLIDSLDDLVKKEIFISKSKDLMR